MKVNWNEDWSEPPLSDSRYTEWLIYISLALHDESLTHPTFYIRRWLLKYGLQLESEGSPEQEAIRRCVDSWRVNHSKI
jgi:hypothetical protein